MPFATHTTVPVVLDNDKCIADDDWTILGNEVADEAC